MIPLPTEFKAMIEQMLGDEAPAFFASMEEKSSLALRINPLRSAAAQIAEDYADGSVAWEPLGRYLKENVRPGAGIAHMAGAFYLQEASAMVSAAILQAQPGERILDLCAAPGGKSTQAAAYLAGDGLLVSNEPEPGRAKVLASNIERLGVQNAVVVNHYPDALAKKWPGYFDAIICDAPCSGEGMFRREPEARSEWNPASPAGCAKRQAEILDRAAELLRPGGRLIYSTCTFNENENEGSISSFLERHPDFQTEDFSLPGLGDSKHGCIRVWPQRVRGDGHFAAKLRKAGDASLPAAPVIRPDKENAKLVAQLEGEICTLNASMKISLLRQGDYLLSLPEECPDLKGIRVVSAGVKLARIGRNYIEPEHALAMAIRPEQAQRRMELSDDQAQRYLAGEALPFEGEKGWTLITWRNLPLGWGKASNGQMKNHLPKGLRRQLHI